LSELRLPGSDINGRDNFKRDTKLFGLIGRVHLEGYLETSQLEIGDLWAVASVLLCVQASHAHSV